MVSPFNILQHSPHDFSPAKESPINSLGVLRWIPSRYNVRATTADGQLVLWNTYTGKISVFKAKQRDYIQSLLSRKGFDAKPEGMVKYLYERGYLIKEDTDEYRRIQLEFGRKQYRTDRLELILLASEDCNFRCRYCYEDFARGTMRPSVREGVKKLIKKRLPGLRTLVAGWFGGEPLYGFQAIEDLAPFFVEIVEKNGLSYQSHMTTNGYLLTPEVAEKLLAWQINSFQITLDGAAAQHDCSRPARNGEGTFARIFKNLRALRERPDIYRVDIRVNFDRNNYPHLGELLDLVEQEFRGDSRFRMQFRAVGQWGGDNDASLNVCGTDESRQLRAELRAETRRRGLRVSDDIRDIKVGSSVCYAARPYNFIVGASGKLMKCTVDLDKQDRNVVGHLNDDGEMILDQDKLALWTEPAFEQDKKCQKCVVLPACQGIFCPLIRIESNQSPCTPLRRTLKAELREALEAIPSNRTVSVG
jgi:uncharacterized protein